MIHYIGSIRGILLAYSAQVRRDCLQHAILQQLKAPPAAFADTIRTHFLHKRASLLMQLNEWDRGAGLKTTINTIKGLLNAL